MKPFLPFFLHSIAEEINVLTFICLPELWFKWVSVTQILFVQFGFCKPYALSEKQSYFDACIITDVLKICRPAKETQISGAGAYNTNINLIFAFYWSVDAILLDVLYLYLKTKLQDSKIPVASCFLCIKQSKLLRKALIS